MPLRWMTDAPSPDLAVEDVDLDLADGDRRHDRPVDARCPTHDDDRPRQQLLGREGRRDDVVHAEVERPQLRRQIAPPGQPEDRGHAGLQRVRRPQALEQLRAVVMIHVDDGDVRRPSGESRVGLIEVADRPDHEQPVVERELDQIGDQWSVLQDECAPGVLRRRRVLTVGHDPVPMLWQARATILSRSS